MTAQWISNNNIRKLIKMAEWEAHAFVDVWRIDIATSASTSLLADEMAWRLMVDDSGPLVI